MRFDLIISSLGFILTYTSDLHPKFTISLFMSLNFLGYLNSTTFPLNVEWHQNSYLGFSYQNMVVDEVRISKFDSEIAFPNYGYFCHISNSRGVSASRSLSYLIFVFWRLWRHQFVKIKSWFARYTFWHLNMHRNTLVIFHKYRKSPLYYTVHKVT